MNVFNLLQLYSHTWAAEAKSGEHNPPTKMFLKKIKFVSKIKMQIFFNIDAAAYPLQGIEAFPNPTRLGEKKRWRVKSLIDRKVG